MANGQKRRRKRRPRKAPRARRGSSQNSFIMQSVGAVVSIVLVIFLKTANIISDTIAIVICMVILSAMFYFMFADNPKPRKRRQRTSKKAESQEKDPQFYTALPSTLGLTEIPEQAPAPQVKLPPRPIRAARRRRDFVTYPLAVGGGDYSDSYVQVDKDTVLRLRSEMSPEAQSLKLPGQLISSFPSSKGASVMSQDTELGSSSDVSEVAPVVVDSSIQVASAEPIVSEAAPVVVDPAPVVTEAEAAITEPVAQPVGASTIDESAIVSPAVATPVEEDEEEEEMEFDMEWD